MIIGIDAGISTTKIVGLDKNGRIVSPIRIKADDPLTSLYGAFGKFLHDNNITLSDVEQIMLTGVGASYIQGDIYGIKTTLANEFLADGLGARHETNIERMLVVSMGTGTSFVQCDKQGIRCIGSMAMGGGTLIGLSSVMLKTENVYQILELAEHGDISNIDVTIGDISATKVSKLPMDATASLFGNARPDSKDEDIALGIIWLVLQTIGSSAILTAQGTGITDFVLIGNLSLLPQCRKLFPMLEDIYHVRFHIPKYSEFSTAIGAALSYKSEK